MRLFLLVLALETRADVGVYGALLRATPNRLPLPGPADATLSGNAQLGGVGISASAGAGVRRTECSYLVFFTVKCSEYFGAGAFAQAFAYGSRRARLSGAAAGVELRTDDNLFSLRLRLGAGAGRERAPWESPACAASNAATSVKLLLGDFGLGLALGTSELSIGYQGISAVGSGYNSGLTGYAFGIARKR
jgi:hypothetical protein